MMSNKDPKSDAERAAKDKKLRRETIGTHLKSMYEEVAAEPIPADFLELLECADDQAKDKGDEEHD